MKVSIKLMIPETTNKHKFIVNNKEKNELDCRDFSQQGQGK